MNILYSLILSNRLIILVSLSLMVLVLFTFNKSFVDSDYSILVNLKERKYVFFDLGVNNGDSLLTFFDLKNKGFTGGSLSYKKFGNEAETIRWEAYAFEANPVFNDVLKTTKEKVEKKHSIQMFNETAAWTNDGTISFYLDTVNEDRHFWGSSLIGNHPDVVRSGKKNVTVKCVDIARIIRQYSADDFIVVKMDIEGAEYDLLLDFVVKDVYKLIDYMAVEFHPSITKFKDAKSILLQIMKLYGTNYVNWH